METCIIPHRLRRIWTGLLLAALAAAPWHAGLTAAQDKKPKLTVAVNPPLGFANARIVATAALNGGADDFEDFYCARVEWEWGDGAIAESGDDCDPYKAGKSQIRRRFSAEHKYEEPGNYKVTFRLKQGKKIVAYAETTARIQ